MTNPKISVIVPVYNVEKYLHRCIDSILAQTFTDFELLLINDGSKDNSGIICDEYAAKDNRVRVFHKENGGASTARNMGLDNAKGEWIAFVDSDDWIEAEMYKEMLDIAENSSVDAVYCDMVLDSSNENKVLCYNNNYDDHKLMYDCLAPIDVVHLSMCNRLISNSVFKKNNLRADIGANMWEDVELAVKVRRLTPTSRIINKVFYHYNRENDSSTTHSSLPHRISGQIERVQAIEHFFKENGDFEVYKHFVSLLKFHAKAELFGIDKKRWVSTFAEAKWSLYRFGRVYSGGMLFKYVLFSFFAPLVIPIYSLIYKK